MAWKPIPIVDGSYADDSRSFSAQDTVNWLPVAAEQAGARSNTMLRTAPGLQEFAQIGDGPHRGARHVEGKLFIVTGQSMYQVSANGYARLLGTVPGRSRVAMTHNQIAGGNEVVVMNGSAGYIWNTLDQTFTQITDPGFKGGIACDFIGQLVVSVEPGRRFFANSGLADAGDYNTIERYESEASPDRLRTLIVNHLEVWLMNERTIEVFLQTTDPSLIADHILFVRAGGTVIERGCAGTHTVCKLDNGIFWVGDDGVVYRNDGYTPIRISTQAIEQQLGRCDLTKAWMFTWSDNGHSVVYLTCPDGRTWGYDVSSRKWHRRESYNMKRWRLNTLVQWNGGWYGGDKDGMLWRLSWKYAAEGGAKMVRKRTSGVLHDHQNRVTVHSLEFVFDTGGEDTGGNDVYDIEAREYAVVTPPPLTLGGTLADGTIGVPYSSVLTPADGVPPYGGWSITEGALPFGLVINASTGYITGTPA